MTLRQCRRPSRFARLLSWRVGSWSPLVFVFLLLSSASSQARDLDFLLINRTGVDIQELYVSSHDTQEWEEDLLRTTTLVNGGRIEVTFSSRERTRQWDIKIVDGEGESLEWTGLNLDRISQITLYLRNGEAYADVK